MMGRKNKLDKEEMRKHILSKVQYNSAGCWMWTGKKNTTSSPYCYGVMQIGGRQYMATAVSFWAFHPEQKEILVGHGGDALYHCHKCDNTICINPDHIFLGTQKDNCRDSMNKRRHWGHRMTTCKYGHLFDEQNTFLMNGHYRICITCRRNRQRARMGITPDRYRV